MLRRTQERAALAALAALLVGHGANSRHADSCKVPLNTLKWERILSMTRDHSFIDSLGQTLALAPAATPRESGIESGAYDLARTPAV